MRIGIDARITYYSRGGIRNYVIHLLDALAVVDSRTKYYVLHSRKDGNPPVPGPNFRPVRCWTPSHHRWEKWIFAAEVSRLGLDILHSTDFIPPAFGYRRSITTIHDLNFLHYAQFLTAESRRYYNDQIEWAVRRTDHILTDSRATCADVVSLLDIPKRKVSVVHLAAHSRFRSMSGQESASIVVQYGLTSGYVLFVGTLEPRKNLPGLLQAYRIIRDRDISSVPLVVVGGKGWLYGEIFERLRELELTDYVKFIHGIPDSDMPAVYNAASLLITPSFYEGFGLPALEAMACGTPVIGANRASLPEVIGDAGILIDPEDPTDIANGMERVLTNPGLQQHLREAGIERSSRFSWEKTALATLNAYRCVMQNE